MTRSLKDKATSKLELYNGNFVRSETAHRH